MKKPWENDSCEHVQSYYTVYPVPVAAALWCGIPPGEIQEHLDASTQVHRAVYRHPYIPCLEPRCRAMHEAIDKGALLVSRENGKSFDGTTDHVAHERRHVTRQNLKEWIAREFPADKPKGMHWRTFERLKADHDAFANASWAGMAERLGLMNRRMDDLGIEPLDDLGRDDLICLAERAN